MFCLKYRAGEIGFAFEMAKLSSHPEHIPEHEPKQHYCADGPGEYGIAAGTVQAGEALLEELERNIVLDSDMTFTAIYYSGNLLNQGWHKSFPRFSKQGGPGNSTTS